jgi:hypothetical protein
MENIHQETVNVRTYECGPDGTIYPHDLLRQMQEVASNHADRGRFGAFRKMAVNQWSAFSSRSRSIPNY